MSAGAGKSGGPGRVGARIGTHDSGTAGRLWRALFWAAAAFNLAIGLLTMLSPASDVDGRIVGLLVFAFGIIYVLVARDAARFGPALWAGLIGKVGVVALLAPQAFGEGGNPAVAGALAIDALFALGFLAFLLRSPSGKPAA